MKDSPHKVELVLDGKVITTTGKRVVLKIDGNSVYDFDSFGGKIEFDLDEFEVSTIKFLLRAANSAFGHADRFQIITNCAEQPKTFSEIKKLLRLTSPTLDYHLKRLIESWVLYKNEQQNYALTLLGQLILGYFSDFIREARELKNQIH